ncbi:class II fumarate hydratase [Pajaroellobacter abortibovis]|uniref:Fumarate hydratase class II n=1 Tax=Pajaroellobacter abortibovis TaxID=1882918 RepID=A0A1L6MW40_9BACT|nr:class II fumarate hydratase [Pajaroellobacter abortibovis]APR99760.1 fumarate hydratase, class II [Pajaroellobacter abortibovis]
MKTRTESDSMGTIEVPEGRYWGAQTQRSLQNFRIGDHRFPPIVIRAFGIVKKAAALANASLGKLDSKKCDLIVRACQEVIEGKLNDHFPLVVWQTGSGTQSNMNANEVIANRAIELAGGQLGSRKPIHPNDDVNRSQSSNDCFPTVMHVAAALEISERLLPAVRELRQAFEEKSKVSLSLIKVGRTHMMDATPLTLGQEFSGYAAQLKFAEDRLNESLNPLYHLALGGSAVGTGLNVPIGYAEEVARQISALTKAPFCTAENKFASLAGHDAIVSASAATRSLATVCFKIANDIRLLASGPRCGLGELILPSNEPGSSIMPGKVNPTQAEALTMVAVHVIGNDTAIAFAGASGHLELNVYKPVLIHNLLESISLLADACQSFTTKCVQGIKVNQEILSRNLANSLMLVTVFNPIIGYDNAAKIAKMAYEKNITLKQAALQLKLLTEEQFDAHFKPEEMIGPST